ncbi:hypothetical protein [Bacillus sp. AFS031507]|nr:hypothetical protein [Bacillus sp. AFS031507]
MDFKQYLLNRNLHVNNVNQIKDKSASALEQKINLIDDQSDFALSIQ